MAFPFISKISNAIQKVNSVPLFGGLSKAVGKVTGFGDNIGHVATTLPGAVGSSAIYGAGKLFTPAGSNLRANTDQYRSTNQTAFTPFSRTPASGYKPLPPMSQYGPYASGYQTAPAPTPPATPAPTQLPVTGDPTGGLGVFEGMSLPTADQATLDSIAGIANGMVNSGTGIRSMNAKDIMSGTQSKQRDLIMKAIESMLGFDTSPEAKRIAELKTRLGELTGNYETALSQINLAPGLTTFASGRRTADLNASAGRVASPIEAELEALTGLQDSRMEGTQNAISALNTLNTMDKQDQTPDIQEYLFAKNQGYQGSFLQFQKELQASKAQTGDMNGIVGAILENPALFNGLTPTIKGAIIPALAQAGFTFPTNLPVGAQERLADLATVSDLAGQIGMIGETSGFGGVGGFGKGQIKDFLYKQAGIGDDQGALMRSYIGNLQGTIQKMRAGTSFTEGEKKNLERYSPTIGESAESLKTKLQGLNYYIQQLRANTIQNASGILGGSTGGGSDPLGLGFKSGTSGASPASASRVAEAIKKVESGGNYNARGGSGEFGAYQFMPSTWQAWSTKYLGKVVAPTPQAQDYVAKARISELQKQGYNPTQIALIWNGGQPVVKRGVNKYGVKYDSGAYARKVVSTYNRLT